MDDVRFYNRALNSTEVQALYAETASGQVPSPACGAANNTAVSIAPTTNLCTSGTATAVTGTGPWSWTCGNGVTTAACSASRQASSSTNQIIFSQVDTTATCGSVTSYLTIVNQNGQPLSELTSANFSITEDGAAVTPFTLTPVTSGSNSASVALVMDYSGSMAGQATTDMQTAAGTFINQLGSNDSAEIVKFATSVSTVQPYTSDKGQLQTAISGAWSGAGGSTALYDAIYQGISDTSSRTGRKAVVILTDGVENVSTHSLNNITSYAIANGIPLFTIAMGSADQSVLQQLATATGGKFYSAASSADLQNIYSAISSVILNQYIISHSTGHTDGGIHTLNITASAGGASATATRTYTACILPSTVNGICGSASGKSYATAPSSNLCSNGIPTSITQTNTWNWTCSGTSGGSTATCGAEIYIANANIYLNGDDSFTVSNSGLNVFGGSGINIVTISSGVSGITFDQNIEQVILPGASGSYTFKQTGNRINIYDSTGTTLIFSIPVQGDSDGTILVFSDGAASAYLISGVMTLGGATVSSTPTTLKPTLTTGNSGGNTTSQARIYLASDSNFTASTSGMYIYGNKGSESVTLSSGISGITLDQNIERINLLNTAASYAFKQTGNKLNIYDATGTTLLVSVPVQGDSDGTVLSFSDRNASAKVSMGVMTLGGATVSTTVGAVTP